MNTITDVNDKIALLESQREVLYEQFKLIEIELKVLHDLSNVYIQVSDNKLDKALLIKLFK